MIPAGTAVACLLVFALFVCVVILDGIHQGDYRRRVRRDSLHITRRRIAWAWLTSWLVYLESQQLWAAWDAIIPRRRVRAALPRRPARLAPEDAATVRWVRELRQQPTWTAAMLRTRLTVLAHVIGLAQIPPTETPDPQPRLDYDETCESWDAVRTAALADMLAEGDHS